MRVLLTGASGYLGQYLLRELLRREHEVVALARRDLDFLPKGEKCRVLPTDGDVSGVRLEQRILSVAPEAIIHTAAVASAPQCEEDPVLAHSVNTEFSGFLAELSEKLSCKIVHCSTDLVFDGIDICPEGGIKESEPVCPISVYSKTKVDAEKALLLTKRGIVARLSLLYGPEAPYGDGKRGPLGWMADALRSGGSLTLFSDEWRTPLFVEDAARFLCLLAENEARERVYHLSGPLRVTRVEFGEIFVNLSGGDLSLIKRRLRSEVPSKPGRPADVSLNNETFCQEFRVQPVEITEAFRLMSR